MMHAHPVDRRVESFDVRRALQAEDQRVHVRVHVPDGAAGSEPAGVGDGRGELHALEEVFPPDVLVETVVEHLADDLVRQVHGSFLLIRHSCSQNTVWIRV